MDAQGCPERIGAHAVSGNHAADEEPTGQRRQRRGQRGGTVHGPGGPAVSRYG